MTEIECVAKRWGSSIGVIIPKNIVDEQKIKPDQIIRIEVKVILRARDIWNIGPIKDPMPTQKIKDMVRAGW